MDSYEITANAKLNLFLRVKGTLPNGYHSLYTIMQEIDCADTLTVNIDSSRSGIEIKCIGRDDINPKKNLCRKACDRFYSNLRKIKGPRFKIPYTEIILTKNIPSESGLGGGSSDAAAVLMVLQEHFGEPFEEEDLGRIAVNVGADVPFFLYGGTALCENVGEAVTSLAPMTGIGVLLVKPSSGVSTPECFARIDSNPPESFESSEFADYIDSLKDENKSSRELYDAFLEGGPLLVNDLEAPACETVPQIKAVREVLEEKTSTRYCRMTGSGSAVFALFDDKAAANEALEAVKGDERLEGCAFFVAETV